MAKNDDMKPGTERKVINFTEEKRRRDQNRRPGGAADLAKFRATLNEQNSSDTGHVGRMLYAASKPLLEYLTDAANENDHWSGKAALEIMSDSAIAPREKWTRLHQTRVVGGHEVSIWTTAYSISLRCAVQLIKEDPSLLDDTSVIDNLRDEWRHCSNTTIDDEYMALNCVVLAEATKEFIKRGVISSVWDELEMLRSRLPYFDQLLRD